MKVVQRTPERLVFGLGVREKVLLDKLLAFYPLQPEARPGLSRTLPAERVAEAESLLHESLRDQKKEQVAWLQERFSEGRALGRTGSGWRLNLKLGEVEVLLRIFNELRVGAWTRLGSPDNLDDPALAERAGAAPYHAIMTVAGQFEMVLLMGLQTAEAAENPPGPPSPSGGTS